MNKRIILFLFFGVMYSHLLLSQGILSETRTWDGDTDDKWMTMLNWDNDDIPEDDADVIIDNTQSVIFSSPNIETVESLYLGKTGNSSKSGDLTIESGATLTLTKGGNPGSHGLRLDGFAANPSVLTVNGTLNVNGYSKGDGIDLNQNTHVIVGTGGTLNVIASKGDDTGTTAADGIVVSDDLSNSGTINISATSVCQDGIRYSSVISGGAVINNFLNAGLTINGGGFMRYGMDLSDDVTVNNFGTLIISGTTDDIVNGNVDFNNYGTFGGDGTVNASDFDAGGSGATISPGTPMVPVGKITFINNDINLSNVDIDIDINSATSYDQLEIIGNIMTITGAELNFSGSYVPVPGDEFVFINNLGTLSGAFQGLGEGDPIFINGVEMTLTYVGGDGNDISIKNLAPLPVELISFNGSANERSNSLKWQTASEENTMVFIVERSLDGARDFEEIDRINAVGFSTTLQSYEVEDINPVSLAYYRLRIVDFDGTFEFSDIIVVERSKTEIETVEVFPVPAEEEVTVLIHSLTNSKAIMILSDFSGKKIKEEKIELNPGINKYLLNWDEHESNFYYLSIDNGKEIISKKILRASRD